MWICNRCQHENKEALTDCQYCGAPRSAGRFSSGQTGRFPRPSAAPQQREALSPRVSAAPDRARAIRMPADDIPDPLPDYSQDDNRASGFSAPRRRPVMGLARVVGLLLCILLPALAGFLAWRQYDVLNTALIPLLLNQTAPEWAKIAVFCGFCLITGLLSLLPGLWTLMKIPPRLRKVKQEDDGE